MKPRLIDIDYIDNVVDGTVIQSWVHLSFDYGPGIYEGVVEMQEEGTILLYEDGACIVLCNGDLPLDGKKEVIGLIGKLKIKEMIVYPDALLINFQTSVDNRKYSMAIGNRFSSNKFFKSISYKYDLLLPAPSTKNKSLYFDRYLNFKR